MPTNKHKRKASSHSKPKRLKQPGLITSHPNVFTVIGLLLIATSIFLIAFEAQNNAMFGIAMISLIIGIVIAISAKLSIRNKN